MDPEYYLTFTNAISGYEDITSGLIEIIEEKVLREENIAQYYKTKPRWNFSKETIPFIGEINVFKTNRQGIALLVHATFNEHQARDVDMYVFPITSNKKK